MLDSLVGGEKYDRMELEKYEQRVGQRATKSHNCLTTGAVECAARDTTTCVRADRDTDANIGGKWSESLKACRNGTNETGER